MAMNTTPVYTRQPLPQGFVVSTANTNLDGTGTIVDIATASSHALRIDWVRVKATGTTTAGLLRLFIHNGSKYRLLDEIPVSAITPTATVQSFAATWTPPDDALTDGFLTLQGSDEGGTAHKLGMSTHNAESFHVNVGGGSM